MATPDTTIRFGAHEIDLNKAFPLTIGDWEQLENEGIRTDKVDLGSPKVVVSFMFTLAHKVDPAVTRDDVRSVPMTELPKILDQLLATLTASNKKEEASLAGPTQSP